MSLVRFFWVWTLALIAGGGVRRGNRDDAQILGLAVRAVLELLTEVNKVKVRASTLDPGRGRAVRLQERVAHFAEQVVLGAGRVEPRLHP